MTFFAPQSAALTCHPVTPCRWVRNVGVRVWRRNSEALALNFCLAGDLAHLRIPPLRPPRRADDLWRHTCFEAFVAPEGAPAYREFNFAPSSEWAAYAFRRYRDGEPLAQELDPEITVRSTADRLQLTAVIRLDCLPSVQPGTRMRLALSAVVEDDAGNLSCWALRHPPGRPDFHHPDAFALTLEPTGVDAVPDPACEGKR